MAGRGRRRLQFTSTPDTTDKTTNDLIYLTEPQSYIGPSKSVVDKPEIRYNFDFANDRPLSSKAEDCFKWEAVQSDIVPSYYQSTIRVPPKIRRCQKSPTPVSLPMPTTYYSLRSNSASISRNVSVDNITPKQLPQPSIPQQRRNLYVTPRVRRHPSASSRGPTPPFPSLSDVTQIRHQPLRRAKKSVTCTRTPHASHKAVNNSQSPTSNRKYNLRVKSDIPSNQKSNVKKVLRRSIVMGGARRSTRFEIKSDSNRKFGAKPLVLPLSERSIKRVLNMHDQGGDQTSNSSSNLSTPVAFHTRSHQ